MNLRHVGDNIELSDNLFMARIPIDKSNHNITYFLCDIPPCKAIEINVDKLCLFKNFAEEIANLYRFGSVRRGRGE